MVSKATRETARAYIIEQGAGYYQRLIARNGVEMFSELPDAEMKRQAAASNAVAAASGEKHADV